VLAATEGDLVLPPGGGPVEPGVETYPPGTTTGEAVPDVILVRLTAGDLQGIADGALFRQEPCVVEPPQGSPQPPECPDGVEDGTPVEVLDGSDCEGFFILPAEVPETLQRFFEDGPGLYAVYRTDAGDYGLVYAVERGGAVVGATLVVGQAEAPGIVALHFGCTEGPREVFEAAGGETVLPPLGEEPLETPTAEPTHAPGTRTNIPGVDAILDAIEAVAPGDVAALVALVAYSQEPCASQPPQGIPQPPVCPPGVEDGTPANVLPAAQCEGTFVTEDKIASAFAFLANPHGLYAVYEVPAGGNDFLAPDGGYGIVVAGEVMLGLEGGQVLFVNPVGGITGVNFGCGESPADLVPDDVELVLKPV
jgi:hypothetical protein